MDFMFNIIFTLFPFIFLALFGLIIYTFVSNIVKKSKQNRANDAAPRLSIPAVVVAKRTDVTVRHRGNHVTTADSPHAHHYTSSTTEYYVTFQVQSGDRMELPLDGSDYGMLAEGDGGVLTFQGTRFLDFERK